MSTVDNSFSVCIGHPSGLHLLHCIHLSIEVYNTHIQGKVGVKRRLLQVSPRTIFDRPGFGPSVPDLQGWDLRSLTVVQRRETLCR